MAEPEILNVRPVEAVEHFRAKGFHVGFDWRDTDAEQHLRSFTVAKAMREDILQDIRGAVDRALADGTTFGTFRAELEPLLRKKGWWGRQPMLDPVTGETRIVQLGSARRLRIVFDTNLRMAYAKGRWERIERVAEARPWLRYVGVLDARTRPQHRAWHGTVLRWDDPWWRAHYPPNGWRCRCIVQQFSDDDLESFGYKPSPNAPNDGARAWRNSRDGKVYQVPVGIDPGFQHNVGLIGRAAPLRAADPWEIPELDEAAATARQLGSQAGSNPGGLFEGADGVRRYVKFYRDPAQAYGEAVANRAYRELNLDAPASALVRKDGKIVGIASEIVENDGALGSGRRLTKYRSVEVLKGYSADVWLANWDAVGAGLDNVVVTRKGRWSIARIDQGGSLLFRARQGRKPADALGRIGEWDGFADPDTNRHYARIFERAGVAGPDELGRKALKQIAAIKKLGERTRDFADLVPKVRGISKADREAILEALRTRARLLQTEIDPRIRAALRAGRGLSAHQAAFVKELGAANYRRYLGAGQRKVAGGAARHGMTDPELAGTYAYTTSDHPWGYRLINEALRSGDRKQVARFKNYRDTVNDALARLPSHVGTVQRGTTLPTGELAEHQVGRVVTYEAFTSASTGSGFSGPHRFVIQSRNGKSVEPYSAYRHEREVLFAAGTRFEVLRREDEGRRITIWLKELE